MEVRKILSLILIVTGLLLITSVSYAWVNPGPYGTNEGIDITLIDENNNEVSEEDMANFKLFNADNVYPGWSEDYVLRIKNKGAASINYTVGLDFEKSTQGPDLADVLTLRVIRGNTDVTYNLTELYNKPVQDVKAIGGGDVHTFNFTLGMAKEAANEYQNLSIDLALTIAVETKVEDDDPGNSGGGKDDKPGKTDPDDPIEEPIPEEPIPEEPIPEEPVPEEPVPEEPVPDENLPDRGDDEIDLPQTGGLPVQVLLGAGIVLVLLGVYIRVRPLVRKGFS